MSNFAVLKLLIITKWKRIVFLFILFKRGSDEFGSYVNKYPWIVFSEKAVPVELKN